MYFCKLVVACVFVPLVFADYWSDRKNFINRDEKQIIGNDVVLNEKEKKANEVLLRYKQKEFEGGAKTLTHFASAQHFFHSRDIIEQSKVFEIIQLIPKGANLHGHDIGLASGEYLYNLTKRNKLYACINGDRDEILAFKFFESEDNRIKNENKNKLCTWVSVKTQRTEQSSFDNLTRTYTTLLQDYPENTYKNPNDVYSYLTDIIKAVTPMISCHDVLQQYFYQALQEHYDDNVMYLEFRSSLPIVYNRDDDRKYTPEDVVGIYKGTVERFKRDHPDFLDAKLIYSLPRAVYVNTVDSHIKIMKAIKKKYPDFVIGFDLVGNEDLGPYLEAFVDQMQQLHKEVKFFFHAGETDWYGTEPDLNVVDAILLGTTRIGHGYSILKHPEVLRNVKKYDIGVEVLPISSQVTGLVKDLRNHPAAVLMSTNYPVVIGNDYPGFWGAKGLSYDWYVAFMGMSNKDTDLRFLKQLAKNSLRLSTIPWKDTFGAFNKWQAKWDKFIDKLMILQ